MSFQEYLANRNPELFSEVSSDAAKQFMARQQSQIMPAQAPPVPSIPAERFRGIDVNKAASGDPEQLRRIWDVLDLFNMAPESLEPQEVMAAYQQASGN